MAWFEDDHHRRAPPLKQGPWDEEERETAALLGRPPSSSSSLDKQWNYKSLVLTSRRSLARGKTVEERGGEEDNRFSLPFPWQHRLDDWNDPRCVEKEKGRRR